MEQTKQASSLSFNAHRSTSTINPSRKTRGVLPSSSSVPCLAFVDTTSATTLARRTRTTKLQLRLAGANNNSNTDAFGDCNDSDGTVVDKNKNKSKPPILPLRKTNVRMQIFRLLNQPHVEIASTMAVLLSSFLVALDTLAPTNTNLNTDGIMTLIPPSSPHLLIHDILFAINVLFAIDFFVRWYAAGNFKPLYLTKPLVALDIVVILLPLGLTLATMVLHDNNISIVSTTGGSVYDIMDMNSSNNAAAANNDMNNNSNALLRALQFDSAGLQNLLLLRILRLRRILTDITTFTRFERALGIKRSSQLADIRPYQLQLARVLLSIFTLLSVSSGLIYTAEHEVNPNIPNYFSALYFGLTTLTTVGFGDVAPMTNEGKIVVCASILAGVAIIPAQAASLVDAILQYQEDRKSGGPRITVTPATASTTATTTSTTSNAKNVAESTSQRSSSASRNVDATPAEQDDEWIGWLGRCCLNCEATDHREDALYCWFCGSEL